MSFFPEALVTQSNPGGLGMNVYVNAPPSGSAPIPVKITDAITVQGVATQSVEVQNWPPVQPVSGQVAVSGTASISGVVEVANFPPPTTLVTASIANWQPTQQVVQGASGSQAWKVDAIPATPQANKYMPVRLTDGVEFYTAGGGGTVSSNIVGLDYPSSAGTFANIDRSRLKKRYDLGSPMYIGFAPMGTLEFEAGWTIKRIITDSDGNPVVAEWTAHAVARWDNRTAEVYS